MKTVTRKVWIGCKLLDREKIKGDAIALAAFDAGQRVGFKRPFKELESEKDCKSLGLDPIKMADGKFDLQQRPAHRAEILGKYGAVGEDIPTTGVVKPVSSL